MHLQQVLTIATCTKKALENEADTEQLERGVMAAGIAKAGQLLVDKIYITNYECALSHLKNKIKLAELFCNNYPDAKRGIGNCFP